MDEEKDLTPQQQEDDLPGDYITLTGQDGQEYQCELVDTMKYNGREYVALVIEDDPTLQEGEGNFDVMRSVAGDDGEAYLEPIEDDEEYGEVSELFMERLSDLYVFEEMDEEEEETE